MTVFGDFSAEKKYILEKMQQHLAALKEDRVLSRLEKELVNVTLVWMLRIPIQCRNGRLDRD